jgi:DNA-directed RNA polymerase subunit RPC12/RpoP
MMGGRRLLTPSGGTVPTSRAGWLVSSAAGRVMKIVVKCPECGFKFRASKKQRGQEVPCPECTHSILVVPRTGLKLAGLGLRFHYAAVPVGIVGIGAFLIGLGCTLCARVAGGAEEVDNVGLVFLILSSVTLLTAGVMDLPAPLLSLRIPDTTSQVLLGVSLPLRLGVIPLALAFILSTTRPIVLMVAVFVLSSASWILWLVFVRRMGLYFGRAEIAREALSVLGSALKTVIPLFLLMGGAVLMVAILVGIESPFGKVVLIGLVVSPVAVMSRAILSAIANSPLIESPFMFLLYPVGIPFYLKYLAILGSLRLLIRRQ